MPGTVPMPPSILPEPSHEKPNPLFLYSPEHLGASGHGPHSALVEVEGVEEAEDDEEGEEEEGGDGSGDEGEEVDKIDVGDVTRGRVACNNIGV